MYTNWVFWHFSYSLWFLFKVFTCFSISFYMSPSYTGLSFVWDVPPNDNLPLSLSLSASPLSASMDGLFWPLSLWHGVNLLAGVLSRVDVLHLTASRPFSKSWMTFGKRLNGTSELIDVQTPTVLVSNTKNESQAGAVWVFRAQEFFIVALGYKKLCSLT